MSASTQHVAEKLIGTEGPAPHMGQAGQDGIWNPHPCFPALGLCPQHDSLHPGHIKSAWAPTEPPNPLHQGSAKGPLCVANLETRLGMNQVPEPLWKESTGSPEVSSAGTPSQSCNGSTTPHFLPLSSLFPGTQLLHAGSWLCPGVVRA